MQCLQKVITTTTKSLQSCPTLCDPIDGSPPGSPAPGILQARILEWVAISFSNAWKWSRSVVSDSSRPHGLQPTRLLCPWDFPGKSTGVGCHCLLRRRWLVTIIRICSLKNIYWSLYCVSHCSGPAVNKTDKDLAHLELTFLVEKMDKQANKRKMYILNCESCSVVSDSLWPMDYTVYGIL